MSEKRHPAERHLLFVPVVPRMTNGIARCVQFRPRAVAGVGFAVVNMGGSMACRSALVAMCALRPLITAKAVTTPAFRVSVGPVEDSTEVIALRLVPGTRDWVTRLSLNVALGVPIVLVISTTLVRRLGWGLWISPGARSM